MTMTKKSIYLFTLLTFFAQSTFANITSESLNKKSQSYIDRYALLERVIAQDTDKSVIASSSVQIYAPALSVLILGIMMPPTLLILPVYYFPIIQISAEVTKHAMITYHAFNYFSFSSMRKIIHFLLAAADYIALPDGHSITINKKRYPRLVKNTDESFSILTLRRGREIENKLLIPEDLLDDFNEIYQEAQNHPAQLANFGSSFNIIDFHFSNNEEIFKGFLSKEIKGLNKQPDADTLREIALRALQLINDQGYLAKLEKKGRRASFREFKRDIFSEIDPSVAIWKSSKRIGSKVISKKYPGYGMTSTPFLVPFVFIKDANKKHRRVIMKAIKCKRRDLI